MDGGKKMEKVEDGGKEKVKDRGSWKKGSEGLKKERKERGITE